MEEVDNVTYCLMFHGYYQSWIFSWVKHINSLLPLFFLSMLCIYSYTERKREMKSWCKTFFQSVCLCFCAMKQASWLTRVSRGHPAPPPSSSSSASLFFFVFCCLSGLERRRYIYICTTFTLPKYLPHFCFKTSGKI